MELLDCLIYCTTEIKLKQLKSKLLKQVGAERITVSFIEKEFYEISVYANDDFVSYKQNEFPDGFLHFKFIIEVGFIKTTEMDDVVDVTSRLLLWLWAERIPAVASCNYEDQLPERGGYGSNNIPWPAK